LEKIIKFSDFNKNVMNLDKYLMNKIMNDNNEQNIKKIKE
jgi:hypothetical protein